jgi:hypothetical protein
VRFEVLYDVGHELNTKLKDLPFQGILDLNIMFFMVPTPIGVRHLRLE